MTAPYRYYKFDWTAGNGATEIAVQEIQLFNSTTNLSQSKAVSSNSGGGSYPIANIVDGNTTGENYKWYASTGFPYWVVVDLGSGSAAAITSYKVFSSGFNTLAPKDWTLKGTNNLWDWYLVDTVTGETSWSALQERSFTPDTAKVISGVTRDSGGGFASFTVRVYRRDTGILLGSTTSNGTTGAYSFAIDEYTGEVDVVMLDDAGGTTENDLVYRSTPI